MYVLKYLIDSLIHNLIITNIHILLLNVYNVINIKTYYYYYSSFQL